jgi:hypothetical protein
MLEEVCSSKTSVVVKQTTPLHIPGLSNNLKKKPSSCGISKPHVLSHKSLNTLHSSVTITGILMVCKEIELLVKLQGKVRMGVN